MVVAKRVRKEEEKNSSLSLFSFFRFFLLSMRARGSLSPHPLRCGGDSLLLRRGRPHRPAVTAAAFRGEKKSKTGAGDASIDSNSSIASSSSPAPKKNLDLAAATALSGAVLGPLCDGLHSRFGVLRYAHPIELSPLFLETTWWTPLLFALAGVIIGTGLPFLDEQLRSTSSASSTSSTSSSLDRGWPVTLLAISAFVLVYFLSAVGGARGQDPTWLFPSLWSCSLLLFAVVDRTPQGCVVAVATALGGPVIEFFLIKTLHLYRYADESFLGAFPGWIVAVYFAGGPSVGALGRRVNAELRARREREGEVE